MDKLLQWSIAQQAGDKGAIDKVGQPDEKMLSQLFGGPDEPTLMKEAILVVDSDDATLENKEVALENFEMLIENLDNANNIENLKLWPSIISQLHSSKPNTLRLLAASCVGIAVQNNPKSQNDFLSHSDGLKTLVEVASDPESPSNLKLKVLFAISSLIRNHEQSFLTFSQLDGWRVLELLDNGNNADNHKLNIRILSVLSSILSNDQNNNFKIEIEPNLHKYSVIPKLFGFLNSDPNTICVEKTLNILSQLVSLNFVFNDTEIKQLAHNLKSIEHLKTELDDFNAVQRITK